MLTFGRNPSFSHRKPSAGLLTDGTQIPPNKKENPASMYLGVGGAEPCLQYRGLFLSIKAKAPVDARLSS